MRNFIFNKDKMNQKIQNKIINKFKIVKYFRSGKYKWFFDKNSFLNIIIEKNNKNILKRDIKKIKKFTNFKNIFKFNSILVIQFLDRKYLFLNSKSFKIINFKGLKNNKFISYFFNSKNFMVLEIKKIYYQIYDIKNLKKINVLKINKNDKITVFEEFEKFLWFQLNNCQNKNIFLNKFNFKLINIKEINNNFFIDHMFEGNKFIQIIYNNENYLILDKFNLQKFYINELEDSNLLDFEEFDKFIRVQINDKHFFYDINNWKNLIIKLENIKVINNIEVYPNYLKIYYNSNKILIYNLNFKDKFFYDLIEPNDLNEIFESQNLILIHKINSISFYSKWLKKKLKVFQLNNNSNNNKIIDFKEINSIIILKLRTKEFVIYDKNTFEKINLKCINNKDRITYWEQFDNLIRIKINKNSNINYFYHSKSLNKIEFKGIKNYDKLLFIKEFKNYYRFSIGLDRKIFFDKFNLMPLKKLIIN